MDISSLILGSLMKTGVAKLSSIGTFSLQRKSARLIQETAITFVPPQNSIVFVHESVDDSSFASFVSLAMQCAESKAREEITTFVGKITQTLGKGNPVLLKGVGVLYPDWSFESRLAANSDSDSFGLENFSARTLSEDEKKKSGSGNSNVVVGAAKTLFIASPILFGALLIPNILQVSQNPQFASIFRDTQVTVDSSLPDMPRPHEFKPVAEAVAVVEEIRNEPSTVQENPRYFIVVGTFSDVKNAKRFAQQLKRKKFDSGILEGEKNRVYVSAFSDISSAKSYMKQLHEQASYRKAWIYEEKA